MEIPKARRLLPATAGEFCCSGCEYVYGVIHTLGLEHFYTLKEELPGPTAVPATVSNQTFAYLDDETFAKECIRQTAEGQSQIEFVLEGMHCAACVWLLERLPDICSGVTDARVFVNTHSIEVTFDRSLLPPSQLAKFTDSLGYRPHPRSTSSTQLVRQRDRRALLSQMGVAGMSTGNTMLLAVSLFQGWFTGIDPHHERFLQWASLGLAIPAVFYSALPFYRSSLGSLRARTMHIDVPISVGIIAGFVVSIFNTIRGHPDVYYDSICMLIFLLLVGRWLQTVGLERAIDSTDLTYAIVPRNARRILDNGELEDVFVGSLQVGDRVLVNPGETFPADGTVALGTSSVQRAILTGESRPVRLSCGDAVFAGTGNVEHPVQVTLTAVGTDSRMGRLVEQLERSQSERAPIVELTNRLAGRFVSVVLVAALGTLIYWASVSDFATALGHSLALLVVTCPCALGLAGPVTFSVALRRAARDGVLIKNSEVFERLTATRSIFWDKTGTLTEGAPKVDRTEVLSLDSSYDSASLLKIASGLEANSQHPVAQAIREYASEHLSPAMQAADPGPNEFEETTIVTGGGVSGRDQQGNCWRIGSRFWLESVGIHSEQMQRFYDCSTSAGLSPVFLANEKVAQLGFAVGDILKPEADETIRAVQALGIENRILSGDAPELVTLVGERLGIPAADAKGGLSPEQKVVEVSRSNQAQATIMVGDGANDAAAFAAASVGIAVTGGAELSLQAADVFLATTDIRAVPMLLTGSRSVLRTIRRSLKLSLCYNGIAGIAAATGYISPLAAAVLMPISSLTVILSALTLLNERFAPNSTSTPLS